MVKRCFTYTDPAGNRERVSADDMAATIVGATAGGLVDAQVVRTARHRAQLGVVEHEYPEREHLRMAWCSSSGIAVCAWFRCGHRQPGLQPVGLPDDGRTVDVEARASLVGHVGVFGASVLYAAARLAEDAGADGPTSPWSEQPAQMSAPIRAPLTLQHTSHHLTSCYQRCSTARGSWCGGIEAAAATGALGTPSKSAVAICQTRIATCRPRARPARSPSSKWMPP